MATENSKNKIFAYFENAVELGVLHPMFKKTCILQELRTTKT